MTQNSPWKVQKPVFSPRLPQIRAMKMMVQESGSRIFLKPGQGKTAAVLKAFQVLKKLGMVDCLLVLAPLRVVTTSWPQQIDFWQDFESLTHTLIHGGQRARREAMQEDVDVYLMNVEGLIGSEWKPGKTNSLNSIARDWLADKRVMLVVDESTKFKNPQSARFKSLKAYLPYINRRVILTGTPRPGKLEDLFAQCFITDLGADLGKFITHFRRHYMMPNDNGFGYTEVPGAMERVAAKIAPTTVQIETEEVVPTEVTNFWLPMSPEVKAQYNELKKEFLISIQGKTVMAPNSGVLYGKLRQMAQGAVFDTPDYKPKGEKTPWIRIHDMKLDALENLLEELNGEPAFCLYQYSHDYERINERLGYVVPRVGGGVSAAAGALLCRAFAGGGIPLLLGHPQSVAHGVDGLQQACKNVIWFGNDPSWENYYQANLRIVRPGTKADQVNIYHLLMDCSVEKAILAKVTGKRDAEANFLSSLREFLVSEE